MSRPIATAPTGNEPGGIAPNWRRHAAARGIRIEPLSSRIGSEVGNVDLSAAHDPEILDLLRAACAERAVLVFRNCRNLSRRALDALVDGLSVPGRNGGAIALIHTVDGPLRFGETRFVDGTAAWAALPPVLRQTVADADTGAARPLVRAHLPSGQPCLDVVGIDLRSVEGLPKEEALSLGAALDAHVLRLRLAYTHRWRAGDVLLVEDRCRMHSAPGQAPLPRKRTAETVRRIERAA